MDAKDKRRIESFAWDCTVGSGRAEELADLGGEPGADELGALSRWLRRPLTNEDIEVFHRAWDRSLQEAMQP